MSGDAVSPLLDVTDLRAWISTDHGVARAVDGVSFSVASGESLGLVGESGCGKTMTALSVLGLLPPRGWVVEGSSVRWRGEELVGAESARLRELRGTELAMVFQEPESALNPVLPIGVQITEGLRHGGMGRAEAGEVAVRLLDEVGIAHPDRRIHDYPHQLSGGMQQRVLIAMALACEPELLIADEPTSALDVTIQAQILDLVGELRRSRRMALVFISHDLAVVSQCCDRIAVMYAGQVVEVGSTSDVLARPAHPYTAALLRSRPSGGLRRAAAGESRLEVIEGSVPTPLAWPDGCRFRPRCPQAFDRCSDEPERFGPDERWARCWLRDPAVSTVRTEATNG